MTPGHILAVTTSVTLVALTGCALYGFRHGNDLSLIDGYYGLASLVHGILTLLLWHPLTARGALLCGITELWALGLGTQLGVRWYREKREHGGDVRYRMTADFLRLDHEPMGSTALHRLMLYVAVALPQVLLIAVLNLPLQFAIMTTKPGLSPLDCIGLAAAALGAVMEVSSNRQLAKFRVDSRPGQTLMSGWWYWSRHPNYFGNALVYTGCFIVALSDPSRWWTVVSPIAILIVLRFVLGVRMTDDLMLEKRKDDPQYLRYVHDTPAFVPLPPPLRQIRQWLRPAGVLATFPQLNQHSGSHDAAVRLRAPWTISPIDDG